MCESIFVCIVVGERVLYFYIYLDTLMTHHFDFDRGYTDVLLEVMVKTRTGSASLQDCLWLYIDGQK